MAEEHSIKQRISGISTTRQIAQAMQLVANTKIGKSREKAAASIPFYKAHKELLTQVLQQMGASSSIYTRQSDPEKTLLIVVGSDRGLCGAYNINVVKEVRRLATEAEGRAGIVTVGSRVNDALRSGYKKMIEGAFTGRSEHPFYSDAVEIGKLALSAYEKKEVQRVVLVYTEFVSMLEHNVVAETLLPVTQSEELERQLIPLIDLEPGEESVMQHLLPSYIYATIYHAMLSGAACEQSARVTSMDSAVKNSGELIEKLELEYNQIRQAAITEELNEIIAGADALN